MVDTMVVTQLQENQQLEDMGQNPACNPLLFTQLGYMDLQTFECFLQLWPEIPVIST